MTSIKLDDYRKALCNKHGAFFTPFNTAMQIAAELPKETETVLVACANTGVIAAVLHMFLPCLRRVVVVEAEQQFMGMSVAHHKQAKYVHRVKHIRKDIFKVEREDEPFDAVICDIPLTLDTSNYVGKYKGEIHEYMLIDHVANLARTGYYVLPSVLAGMVTAVSESQLINSQELFQFNQETGLILLESFAHLGYSHNQTSRELVLCNH